MSCYHIRGGRPLEGRLTVQGAKNSALPILAATLLAPGESVIENCPHLSDVDAALAILTGLGCRVWRREDTVGVDASVLAGAEISRELMEEMRSSVVFLGAMLARMGRAALTYPGGCELGPRPIDLHLAALRTLGADIREENGLLRCTGRHMAGGEISLTIPSVGATENAMLAACGCPGVTRISGAAREPEIEDLQGFLQAMGADIQGAGTSTVIIRGGAPLRPARYRVMGDRIAAATYLCAAAAAGGQVALTGVDPEHLRAVLTALEQAGCSVQTGPGEIALTSGGCLCAVPPVVTEPYPGFPTDAQAIFMAALAGGRGVTLFRENIFESRYGHVAQLRAMGADIQVEGREAIVTGAGGLHGADVRGGDLRGAAALVVAGVAARGETQVTGLAHIRRGYDGLDVGLRALGADITETD